MGDSFTMCEIMYEFILLDNLNSVYKKKYEISLEEEERPRREKRETSNKTCTLDGHTNGWLWYIILRMS